jgi:hypothetical protein
VRLGGGDEYEREAIGSGDGTAGKPVHDGLPPVLRTLLRAHAVALLHSQLCAALCVTLCSRARVDPSSAYLPTRLRAGAGLPMSTYRYVCGAPEC